MNLPNTFPETWAWDMHDMLIVPTDDVDQALAAAAGAEALARQKDKVAESLAYHTCDSVTLEPDTLPAR